MFDLKPTPESKPIVILKLGFAVVLAALFLIGIVSSHRAYFQVRGLGIKSDQELVAGSNVSISLTTSGRTTVDVRVELIQHERSTTLFNMQLRGSELAFFDPRPRSAQNSITVTKAQLAGFEKGKAVIRATAVGRPQWGRLPPPTVTDFPIDIQVDREDPKELY